MMRCVAFLRAINTPGRHVKMERLRESFESVGFDNVETFIASGNVIFDSDSDPTADLADTLEAELGFATRVYLRTADQVIGVADLQPFDEAVDDYEVSFLPRLAPRWWGVRCTGGLRSGMVAPAMVRERWSRPWGWIPPGEQSAPCGGSPIGTSAKRGPPNRSAWRRPAPRRPPAWGT